LRGGHLVADVVAISLHPNSLAQQVKYLALVSGCIDWIHSLQMFGDMVDTSV